MNNSVQPTKTINLWHNDKWAINFSNIPTLKSTRDLYMYDNYVKSLTFPEYSMGEIISNTMGFNIRHPLGGIKANQDLSQINIEFKLLENMANYIYLFEYMRSMRYGQVEDFSSEEDMYRKNTIKSINISLLDNQKRIIAIWRFTQAFLLNISSLSLTQGSSDEVTFSCVFSYEEVQYDIKDINTSCGY